MDTDKKIPKEKKYRQDSPLRQNLSLNIVNLKH